MAEAFLISDSDSTMIGESLLQLQQLIRQRRQDAAATTSYTAQLFAKGLAKIAQKVGEEGVELALAAVQQQPDELRKEAADLMYHLLVLCEASNVSFLSIIEELKAREGQSGLEEKASRSPIAKD